jgi:hypothetical protein
MFCLILANWWAVKGPWSSFSIACCTSPSTTDAYGPSTKTVKVSRHFLFLFFLQKLLSIFIKYLLPVLCFNLLFQCFNSMFFLLSFFYILKSRLFVYILNVLFKKWMFMSFGIIVIFVKNEDFHFLPNVRRVKRDETRGDQSDNKSGNLSEKPRLIIIKPNI